MIKGFTGVSGTCGLNLERHSPPAVGGSTCGKVEQWGVKQNTLQTQVQVIGLIAVVSCDVSEQDRRSCYQLSKCPAFLKVYGFEGNNDSWLMKL